MRCLFGEQVGAPQDGVGKQAESGGGEGEVLAETGTIKEARREERPMRWERRGAGRGRCGKEADVVGS